MSNPIYSIVDYMWRLLQQELDWELVNGLNPIIPVDQQPELKNEEGPYITYSSNRETGRTTQYFRPTESAVFRVYAQKVSEVDSVLRLLADALGQFDRSAGFVNGSSMNALNENKDSYVDSFITDIQVTATMSGNPSDDEGGRANGLIAIRYSYTRPDIQYPILY